MADVYIGWGNLSGFLKTYKVDTHIKEYTDTLPQHLLQSWRNANIKDTESESIKTKLQERTSCSIFISYLQLALIKLQKICVAASDFSNRMLAHQERATFGAFLQLSSTYKT